jgi:hypothetical protein
MEFLQIYLPQRVPSNLDLAAQRCGRNAGGRPAARLLLERLGAIDAVEAISAARWFVADTQAVRIVLLALWPVGAAVSGGRAVRAGAGARAAGGVH